MLIVLALCSCSAILLGKLGETLPTPRTRPELVEGRTYWLEGLELPGGLLRSRWIDLYTLPRHEEGSTIGGVLENGSEVVLIGQEGKWCYVEGQGPYAIEEGWIRCNRLLDYEPTPFPTRVRTPRRPG